MAIEVNGELIDDESIRREATSLRLASPDIFEGLDPIDAGIELHDRARHQLISNVLLMQQARKESVPPELQLDQLVGKIIGKVSKPNRKAIVAYYRSHLDEFQIPELVRASHIVRNVDEPKNADQAQAEATAREMIEQVARKLAEGADFATLADLYSDCPGNGGELGWMARGQMVSEFEDVAFALQPGQVSPIFRTIFGFHIVLLIERNSSRMPILEEVYDRIEDQLHRVRQRAALDQFVAQLWKQAAIRELKV